jgi:hypothetical protein
MTLLLGWQQLKLSKRNAWARSLAARQGYY